MQEDQAAQGVTVMVTAPSRAPSVSYHGTAAQGAGCLGRVLVNSALTFIDPL